MASSDSDDYDYSEEEEEDDDDEEEDDGEEEDDDDDENDDGSDSEYTDDDASSDEEFDEEEYGEEEEDDDDDDDEEFEDFEEEDENAAEEELVDDDIANEISDVDDSRALPAIDNVQREPDEISELTDGPFSGQSTPDISLDRAAGDVDESEVSSTAVVDNNKEDSVYPSPVPVRKEIVPAATAALSPDIAANMENMNINERSPPNSG